MSETDMDGAGLVRALPGPAADNVSYGLDDAALRELASGEETTTEYGSPAYVSEFRSRSADRTRNRIDDAFGPEDWAHVESAVREAGEREVLCLDRRVGRHPEVSQVCRLYVPREYARIALAWGRMLEPAPPGVEPDLYTVQLPDREEVAVRVLPDAGLTAVLGSDYTGEAKKSFLRLFMRRAKEAGGLGLHAGSKRLHLRGSGGERSRGGGERSRGGGERSRDGGERSRDGDRERTVGQLFLGLSGTGKTTLTGHGLWLEEPEYAELLQDDVCALLPDGTVAGSEGAGLYVKTEGLDPDEQPAIHAAATSPSAVLENVAVEDDGGVDFADDALTANGRAVVRRADLPSAAPDVDLPSVDQVFFITRNPLMPPVARLGPAEAAAAFMLGESVRTSAGDPERAGEAIRVVGTNPFIVGPEGAEGNRFRELVARNDVECYLLNTGTVGDRAVAVEDTVAILEALARDAVAWTDDPTVGLELPESIPGVDLSALYPPARVDGFDDRIADLRADRRAYLESFPDLDPAVLAAVY